MILIVVAGWLVWELTPLQDWIAEGKSYWDAIGDGISKVSDWISQIGGSDPGTGTAESRYRTVALPRVAIRDSVALSTSPG